MKSLFSYQPKSSYYLKVSGEPLLTTDESTIEELNALADSRTKCNTKLERAAEYSKLAALSRIGVANELHTFDRMRTLSY